MLARPFSISINSLRYAISPSSAAHYAAGVAKRSGQLAGPRVRGSAAAPLGDTVRRVTKTADVVGRLLLGWYLIGTARYLWTGRFQVEVGQLRHTFEAPTTVWTILAPLQICVAAVGVFMVIPLLWRGTWAGLIAGLLYWSWGYPANPLWFVVPSSYFVSPNGGPTALLWVINLSWAATTLVLTIGFFLARRSIVRSRRA